MNLETLADTAFVLRKAQIGRDAAERLRQDGNRAAIVIAFPDVARPLGRGYATFYPVGANGRHFDAKVTVTATQTTPSDLIQRV
jgi:hypothetical protein